MHFICGDGDERKEVTIVWRFYFIICCCFFLLFWRTTVKKYLNNFLNSWLKMYVVRASSQLSFWVKLKFICILAETKEWQSKSWISEWIMLSDIKLFRFFRWTLDFFVRPISYVSLPINIYVYIFTWFSCLNYACMFYKRYIF